MAACKHYASPFKLKIVGHNVLSLFPNKLMSRDITYDFLTRSMSVSQNGEEPVRYFEQ